MKGVMLDVINDCCVMGVCSRGMKNFVIVREFRYVPER